MAPNGSVYVSDFSDRSNRSKHRIQKFTSEGAFVAQWQPERFIGIPFADGLAVGSDGSVYVADTDNGRIQKFSPRP